MSKQPRAVQEALARLKSQGIILPEERNPRQLWLMVLMHPADTHSGEVFLTHGMNYEKFSKRPGFEVLGHGWDKGALQLAARKLTLTLGENYRSKFSNANQAHNRPTVADTSESQTVHSETPDDFLDALGKKPTSP